MNFTHINNYRINLNTNDYIIVDGIQFENISNFYPNIRSIKAFINNQEYNYNEFGENIKNYLKIQYNVNLINKISNRIINKNWFECYSDESQNIMSRSTYDQIKNELLNENQNIMSESTHDQINVENLNNIEQLSNVQNNNENSESMIRSDHAQINVENLENTNESTYNRIKIKDSESMVGSDHAQIKTELLNENQNSMRRSSHIQIKAKNLENIEQLYNDQIKIKDSKNMVGSDHHQIKKELLNEKSDIIRDKLYKTKTLLKNEFKYENEFPTYPIWHINGKHKIKSQYCPLYCHYDIMLHILSLKFVSIESQILNLSTTEFLKATIENKTIDEYLEYSKQDLLNIIEKQKQIINQKDKYIFNLEECMKDIRKTNAHLESKIDNVLEKLDNTQNKLEETKTELTQNIIHNTNLLVDIDNKIENNLNGKTIDNFVTNSVCKIIIMAKFSKSKNLGIFINIRRQTTSKLNSEIKKYKDRNYKLVYEKEVPNAMSVAKYIFNDEKNIEKYELKKIPTYQSRYQTDYNKGKQLKKDFDEIVNSYLNIPLNEIRDIVKEELEPINVKIEEIHNNTLKLPKHLINLNIKAEDYYNLKGKFVKGSNGYYKEVLEDINGILYIQLNNKQIEEIIHDNISEIIYKDNKKDKKINKLKFI